MSSGCRRVLPCIWLLLLPGMAAAQDSAEAIEEQRADMRAAMAEPDCVQDPFQPDTITVCGETTAEETREHMSVLPAPVQSDRVIFRGLTDPPCWIEPRGGVCLRGGFKPPQVVLIDLDAIPVALTPEEAALVSAVEEP